MKRVNNLLPLIEDMDNLRLAFWKASKGKRYAKSVLKYQAHLEANLKNLQSQIWTGDIKIGDYRYFKIYEPKEREICASAFTEQVLHHALMNVCHQYFDDSLIIDTYASRKGKGTYAALEKAKINNRKYACYLKLDIKKFFGSVQHDVLKRQLVRRFKEKGLLQILYKIIDSYEQSSDRGLPIGNLTSQYFANHYLASLDNYIKEVLRAKAYVRYMDDMVLWHDDKEALQLNLKKIESFVKTNLSLELKPSQLNKTKNGLPFLGYRIFKYHVRLLQKSKQRFIRKMNQAISDWETLKANDLGSAAKVLPLIAFTTHADASGLRKCILSQIKGHIP